ncbi:MAG: hypothetical protein CM1200mP1_12470 [Candidatus Neomarinimicrobiota bacterium]|nr:MAG: hypothetical protein CM1200mP1_12470 [Candidatus Neomarinimicrobiota bacterium]
MSNSKVSIIIPHWNGIEILSDCLESLAQTEYTNLEIIVVDNASTDGSPDWVNINYPSVKLIENDRNYGYAGGCNRGAGVATGDYLVFLNNDTIQHSKWIDTLVDFLDLNSNVAAVQPKILNFFDQSKFDYAGGAGGWLDILGYPFARGRVFLEQEKDAGNMIKSAQFFGQGNTPLWCERLILNQRMDLTNIFCSSRRN